MPWSAGADHLPADPRRKDHSADLHRPRRQGAHPCRCLAFLSLWTADATASDPLSSTQGCITDDYLMVPCLIDWVRQIRIRRNTKESPITFEMMEQNLLRCLLNPKRHVLSSKQYTHTPHRKTCVVLENDSHVPHVPQPTCRQLSPDKPTRFVCFLSQSLSATTFYRLQKRMS